MEKKINIFCHVFFSRESGDVSSLKENLSGLVYCTYTIEYNCTHFGRSLYAASCNGIIVESIKMGNFFRELFGNCGES